MSLTKVVSFSISRIIDAAGLLYEIRIIMLLINYQLLNQIYEIGHVGW